MPGWTLSRNVAGEVQRALDVKTLGLEKTRELKPTDPETPFVVPPASISMTSRRRSSAITPRRERHPLGSRRRPKLRSADGEAQGQGPGPDGVGVGLVAAIPR